MNLKRIMIWILFGVFLILGLFNAGAYYFSAPRYSGPVTDHFDGKKFINPGNIRAKGLGDLLKWVLNREKQPWQKEADPFIGPAPKDRINSGAVVTFVNHATFLIQTQGLNILTDPVWSERASPLSFAGPKRMRPPGIRFEELPEIDLVLISHNHYDHLDVPTMKRLIRKFDPSIITPLGVGKFIEQMGGRVLKDMDWWQEISISEHCLITSVPAQHFSGRGSFDRDATLWCGYVIKTGEEHIYFAGDSGYGRFFKEIGDRFGEMKCSMIPIGAYKPEWFMSPIHISPEEAVQVHHDVRSAFSIGMHLGTFPLADDEPSQTLEDLKSALINSGCDEHEFVVMQEGTSISF